LRYTALERTRRRARRRRCTRRRRASGKPTRATTSRSMPRRCDRAPRALRQKVLLEQQILRRNTRGPQAPGTAPAERRRPAPLQAPRLILRSFPGTSPTVGFNLTQSERERAGHGSTYHRGTRKPPNASPAGRHLRGRRHSAPRRASAQPELREVVQDGSAGSLTPDHACPRPVRSTARARATSEDHGLSGLREGGI